MAFQNLLCELYVHNLAIIDDKECNSLLYVGDVQFREVRSWIQNEINHETQAIPYREKEMVEPLYIWPKVQDTRRTYYD